MKVKGKVAETISARTLRRLAVHFNHEDLTAKLTASLGEL